MPDTILKPCPSCGSLRLETNERRHRSGHRLSFVICPKCGLRGPWGKTWVEAEAAWNDLPRAIRWTLHPPQVPGLYLARSVVLEGARTKVLHIEDYDLETAKEVNGWEWAGPIPNIDK